MNNRIIFSILGLLFPARCPGCNKITQRYDLFCDNCRKTLPRITDPCTGCGHPKSSCECGLSDFNINIVSPFIYDGIVAKSILSFKFHGEKIYYRALSPEMARCVRENYKDISFDIITCVPQTLKRSRERGFNQSELLAKGCSDELGVPQRNVLIKTRDTEDQHDLKAKERIKNLKNAFDVNPKADIKGKTVLLCDDIKTTGATLNECCKVLIKGGAKAVYCVTAAIVCKDNIK